MPTIKDVEVRKPSDTEAAECKTWPTWNCKASQFDWDYTQNETCLILEGSVEVTDRPETGQSVTFSPGDMVKFPTGLKCIWKVKQPVKKHYNFS